MTALVLFIPLMLMQEQGVETGVLTLIPEAG